MAIIACLSMMLSHAPAIQALPDQQAVTREVQAEKKHQSDIEGDVKQGKQVAEEVAKELKPSTNQEYIDRVQRIGKDIADIANKTAVKVTWGDSRHNVFNYEFNVVQGDDVNAFSLPGGFIYIYEGAIKFCETDDELAGILAHECSHAAFRHVATLRREQSKFDIVNIPLIFAAIFSKSPEAGNILMGADIMNRAIGSGWSVKAEESADFGGVQYMIASKYNPVGMLTFMERLAFKDRGRPSDNYTILQTHPPSAERARALMNKLQDAGIPIHRSAVSTSLSCQILPGEDGTVELSFGKTKLYRFGGSDALTRADAAAKSLDVFFDSVPALYELGLSGPTKIVGQDRLLIEVSPDDGPNPAQKVEMALSALKKLVFDINYRLWQNHDRVTGSG